MNFIYLYFVCHDFVLNILKFTNGFIEWFHNTMYISSESFVLFFPSCLTVVPNKTFVGLNESAVLKIILIDDSGNHSLNLLQHTSGLIYPREIFLCNYSNLCLVIIPF